MARRSRAREVALQALYQRDQNKSMSQEDALAFLARRLAEPELLELGKALYLGTLADVSAIDERLSQVADNWSVERMAIVDRNVLRLGIYELYHGPETPFKVVLDEAIELAKRYGSEESPGFVNGILDKIANDKNKMDEAKAPAEAAPAV
ncbi:MAG TPA: transcription antitermination factor NusB [Gemmatales bacterium]|nr:transcription antitermination factor NusB [Gemmatales bacterium]